MDQHALLAEQFETHRSHLRQVAYRMLGSLPEAEDAVQEAWIRTSRADTSEVENLGGWLTTVVARVCLNMLQARRTRREDPVGTQPPDAPASGRLGLDPQEEVLLADAVGPALLVVLDTLSPTERLAFVLHDVFAVPFDEIAGIVGRSPAAARQLASRARRRVQGTSVDEAGGDRGRQREVVDAFLAASRHGEFDRLLALLDPAVVLRADPVVVRAGASAEVHGAQAVAETFAGRAKAARPALIDGEPGAVWSMGGTPRVVFAFTIDGDRIVAIDMLGDPDRLAGLDLEMLGR
jgi:RNA polymerase sigma-70 factor (ECF subfamily)